MEPRKKLAIFDLDGTLFDTKNVNYNAYKEALKIRGFDVTVDYQYYCDFCNGNNYKVFLPKIIGGITEEEMKAIHDIKKVLYKSYLNLARINDHLFSMIKQIRNDYIIAIVTTASEENTRDILLSFDVLELFDIIITQEKVQNTKPAPDGFLCAVKEAKVDPKDVIIFEDSEVGMQAAAASGLDYVKVYGYN